MKSATIAVIVQVVFVTVVWAMTVLFAPMFDKPFEKMIFLYWPSISLVSELTGGGGMAGTIVFGLVLGVLVYALIIGSIAWFLRSGPH